MFKRFFAKEEEEESVFETVDPVLEQRRKEKFSSPLIYNDDETEKEEKRKAKQEKKEKRSRQIRWDKLDNTAHLFPVIAGEHMSNVYRISVTLSEKIVPELLQEALNLVLPKFDGFNMRLRRGVFWYYFEENGKKAPIVQEESTYPCQFIRGNASHSYLFRVTYYKYRINLEVFHVLTDGTGANLFFKNLIYHYLGLKYNLPMNKKVVNNNSSSSDKYLKYYDDKYKMMYDFKPAYQIPGIANKRKNNTYHYIININELKKVCKGLNVTITEYLTAVYMYAIYLSLYNKKLLQIRNKIF